MTIIFKAPKRFCQKLFNVKMMYGVKRYNTIH